MTAQDAMCAAEDGDLVITSPNCPFVYQPLKSPRVVQLRSDLRFGIDDPFLYPQWICSSIFHHPLIRCKTNVGDDSVMWWDGAQHCFSQSSDIAVGGVGFVQGSEFEVLERKKSSLAATVQQVLQDQSPQALTQQERDVLTHWHV